MNHFLNFITINDDKNKDTTFPSFFKCTNRIEEIYFDHKLPVTVYDNNDNHEIMNEENIRHFDDDEEKFSHSSNACLPTFVIGRIQGKIDHDRFDAILPLDRNITIPGSCENKQFHDSSNRFDPFTEILSNSVVNSRTFIPDEPSIKLNSTTSNGLFCNTDSFSHQVANPLTQRESIGPTCFMYQDHLIDVPLSTIDFHNIPIKESVPIKFHDYQIVDKVPKEIIFERETSNSHAKPFSNDHDSEFKTFSNPVKVSHSENLASFLKQCESFNAASEREFHLFDLDNSNSDINYNDEYFLQKPKPEKLVKTKIQFQCSKLHLQKILHHLIKETIFPSTRVQRVLGNTNEKANEICSLGNVLFKNIIKNNFVNEKQARPKSLHSEDEFSTMPNLLGFRPKIFETSLQNNSKIVPRQYNTSMDNTSENLFMKRLDNSTSLFKGPESAQSCTILNFHENSSNSNLPLVENKDNNNKDENPLEEVARLNKDRVLKVDNNKLNSNCLLKDSDEDSSRSSEGFSGDEGSLSDEDQFYDCLDDISLENSEKISETTSFLTDDHFAAMQREATFPESHFQEPVIFSYVEEDTHKIDEILIYPKLYIETISKIYNKTLTREEILPKLIENSKFYDGQPIGIFNHVREIRKTLRNKSPHKTYEYSIPASTHLGNGEPSLPQCKCSILKSSKLNKFSVHVGVKKRKSNRKKPIKRNKVKITSKQKFYSESKPFPREFRISNIPQMVSNKSLKQVPPNSFNILYNNYIEKYRKTTKFQQEDHEVCYNISVCSKQKYEIYEAGDQLVTEVPSSRLASAISKLELALFQQRPFNDKYRQQSKLKSGVSKERETNNTPCCASKHTDPSKAKAVLEKPSVVRCSPNIARKSTRSPTTLPETYRKPWGDSMHATSPRCYPAILDEAGDRSMIVPNEAPIICLQKNETSSMRQKQSKPIRKDLKVEDIVSSDFRSYFCFYAKMGHCFRSGSAISKSNSNYWLRRTGVVDSRSIQMAKECFSSVAKSKLVLNIYDYVHYLTALSKRTKMCLSDLIQQLKSVEVSPQGQKKVTLHDVGSATNTYRSSLPPRSRFTLSAKDDKNMNRRPRTSPNS